MASAVRSFSASLDGVRPVGWSWQLAQLSVYTLAPSAVVCAETAPLKQGPTYAARTTSIANPDAPRASPDAPRANPDARRANPDAPRANPKSRIPNPEFRIPNPKSRIPS